MWEVIGETIYPQSSATVFQRKQVPGGWLVRQVGARHKDKEQLQPSFVADPQHEWVPC